MICEKFGCTISTDTCINRQKLQIINIISNVRDKSKERYTGVIYIGCLGCKRGVLVLQMKHLLDIDNKICHNIHNERRAI